MGSAESLGPGCLGGCGQGAGLGCGLLRALPLAEGAVLSPFQILAPLLKENLFCFLSALPPGVEENFSTALSRMVCCLLPAVWLLL